MHTRVHARALTTVDSCLRGGPWSEVQADERARRFGNALLTALREALPTQPTMSAVASACASARGEVPLAAAIFHETWSRVMLVWSVCQLVRAAHAQPDLALREDLLRVASEVASAAAQIAEVESPQNVPQTAFEQRVEAARDAFNRTRDGSAATADERVLLGAYVHQLKHIASLLAVGGHSVDSLLRGAVTRTDRSVRRDGLSTWIDAPLTARQTLLQRGLLEAAWSLAAQAVREPRQNDASRDLALWLARAACQLAARVDRVEGWVPAVEGEPTAPVTAPVTVTAPVVSTPAVIPPVAATAPEKKMDKNPVLKTLEVDASEAAWRLAGSQFVKLAKEPIVALLSRNLGPNDEALRGRIAAFLDTELGGALLAGVLSAGLSAMPLPSPDVAQRLARELRVRAMANAGDVIADVLMGPLRQVAVMYLQGQPTAAPADPAALPANALVDALKVATAHVDPAAVPVGEKTQG